MSLVQILGLCAAAVCLLAYLLRPGRVFDWCNATLWPVVAVASLQAGAWGPLLLNVGFGAAGAWHLWSNRVSRAQKVARNEAYIRAKIRADANKVLMDAADGHVLYYKEWMDR